MTSLAVAIDVVDEHRSSREARRELGRVLMAGAIQNFDFVYELSIRMLRRQLEAEGELKLPLDAMVFRDVLRIAGERDIIDDVVAWFRYRDLRNLTAHTYEEQKALQVYSVLPGFLADARSLLDRLEARNA